MPVTILIVDDEAVQRNTLAGFLAKKGYTTLQAESGATALNAVRLQTVDLVLTDLRMPGMDGAQLLTELKNLNPELEVIMMTAFGTMEEAVQSMKNGALDFITKPIDLGQLELTIARAVERKQLISENQRLQQLVAERLSFSGILTRSEAMQKALSIAARAAVSRITVLILGESGTGKELVAKAIHLASPRAAKPFVAVNLAALPDTLVESELFGHEKGAFTGADRMRMGRFEAANTGTLFIDEVGDMPLPIQAKLLRVLQEQAFERLGSSSPVRVDVRLIAATNRSLDDLVRTRLFREDLYYRLNVVRIELPPLRERKTDIPLLAEHFLRRFAAENNRPMQGYTREAMDLLMKYPFPGNVRELQHLIEQAVVLSRDQWIGAEDLGLPTATAAAADISGGTFTERVEAFERGLIQAALQEATGVQSRAARALGISERHLRYKLQKYGMK
ncbi:MAG TPA: sigma-54 dependent transcriptional regulator [bacterium]|nr:sigma-54 dependent transcriptional regulator [bacterium]HQG45321.1 sigma-54 dependent transcriptional regulator [bacterium]HQI48976.1 sigma-54 dependent transcriptional regulator [bacterium]HQJ65598.1 sigma-54 dependent transcriptional regulator [bacterium]